MTEEILGHVLPNYRSHERPGELSDEPTRVNVFIDILAVTSISVVNMEFTVDLYLRQTWIDPRLAWQDIPYLKHYENSILLTQQIQQLWLPDLFFRNGKLGFMHDISVPNHLIRVFPNGNVLYSQKITMVLSCSMYLRNFPIDRQECSMDLGSYGYTVDELKFNWRPQTPVTVSDRVHLLEFKNPRSAITTVS
ncbi:hypothetical protein AHF37_05770 [Paragonimus kellicotti]|nr:hypothetical protein AHF37_05770 [Paragonimus kellicotti]